MATIPVIGASPITFISEDTQAGKQFQVPLSVLSFDPTGTTIDPSVWTGWGSVSQKDQDLLKALIASMISNGFLTKPPS
jgi:hypothetical protein